MWEEIIDKEPLNILAIKFAHEGYLRMGMLSEMLALTSKVLKHWKPVMPFYGQILNLHSYSLCESGRTEEAEEIAKQSQELDGTSLRAIHSLAYVNYRRNEYAQGIQLLNSTKSLWIDSDRLSSHYLWHLALFYIKRKDFTAAMDVWDTEIKARALAAKPDYISPLLDAASILMRLSMHGLSLQQRWRDLWRVFSRHLKDHVWVMNDLHVLMTAMGTNESSLVRSFKDSIQIYIQTGKGTNHKVTKEVGLTLCEAMVCYGAANHERVVDLTYPIRGQIHRIGGTQAQRDLFHEILISSAGKSRMPSHQKLVRQLMEEKRVP
ncbi:hypothetical protein CAPTEDRAFT_151318 [Capitella teleta]|uniref:Tetratricopeptide repeat protein 38 n=1 Tax=Capitella teleta TaxID=283909 RepID=R7TFC2_CAPTE|nr:hypothetical protein CAPTEDRAFT_151318 [Capitella teleta]|eukprot:ELT90246.1 hypothetical protein CAPTEDRAFT_151318 [Capitella teleta]